MFTEETFSVRQVVCAWKRFYIILFAMLASSLYLTEI
jgi:hypothetical protein